eukprot:356379-Chlamydomonas_euryale.AAC.3
MAMDSHGQPHACMQSLEHAPRAPTPPLQATCTQPHARPDTRQAPQQLGTELAPAHSMRCATTSCLFLEPLHNP